MRYGRAATGVDAIAEYVGGGLRWGSDDAHVGLGIAHARLGASAQAAGIGQGAETAVELTAHRRVAPWLAVQPDLQWVHNPGWTGATPALVGILRLRFDL